MYHATFCINYKDSGSPEKSSGTTLFYLYDKCYAYECVVLLFHLAIAESVRAVVRSSAAYLATMEPVQAQIAAAHAQLMAAFSKEMAYADGKMLAEYDAMDAMELLPQETVVRELDMEAAAEIDKHQL